MNAATAQKAPREYRMHGDCRRIRRLKEAGIDAIDARSRPGREAKAWRAYALEKKRAGGHPIDRDIRQRIDAATFYLWRALCLRAYIVADARKRGTVVNRRSGKLPGVNDQYDTAMNQFLKISGELEIDTGGLDLARRLMLEQRASGGSR